jgi:hypothetical protein
MNQYFVVSIENGDTFNITISPQQPIVVNVSESNGGGVTSVGLQTNETGNDVGVSNSPITSSGNIQLSIPIASATKTGKLSSTDWSTFNSKQNALGFTPENVANKSNDVNTDQASTTKYPSVKAIVDWVKGLFVPYTGATANVDLGTYKITADAVAFSLNPTNSPGAGQIAYKGTTGALAYLMNNSAVECEIGQQLFAYVVNADSVTINKGEAVYLFGASGNKASVKRANNTSDATSAKTLGLAAENIGVNQKGFVICQGVLDGLNTGAYNDGDILYVGATAGALTNVKPYAPNHLVYIGVVERANNGNGQIYVRVQNGYELDEIHDVDLVSTPPVNNDILTYVTGSPNLWKPRSIASILGFTPLSAAIQSLGGQTGATQTLATGTSGTDFGISSASNTHTFNLPVASAANTGKLSNTDWSTFNNKQNALGFTPEDVANKTDLMAGNTASSTKYLSAKGVYDWVTNEFDPLVKRHYFDDLQGMGTGLTGSIFTGTGTLQLEGNISITRSGTTATWARTASEAGHSGIIRGGTGTTNLGACNIAYRGIWMGTNDWVYETSLRIQTLSTATERFTLFFQFGTGTTDSIRLFYSDNVNSGKWQAETYASSVSTTQDTGITVAINTWYNLKIVRLSNVITFYINGSLVATISTNVPSSFDTNAGVFLTKTVGTTTRTCDFDYVKLYDL